MSPPNFLCLDYFGILKKCRGLVAAVELASSWGGRRILHVRCKVGAKDYIVCFFFTCLPVKLFGICHRILDLHRNVKYDIVSSPGM